MPDERLVSEFETIFSEIVELGAATERTRMIPNMLVRDANPTGLDGYVIIRDDRDGDNILARKVNSVVYSDNDLVNAMFVRGGEAVAFQQGSESPGGGDIWQIVAGTSTDIIYNAGDVGIGKSVAPDARLEILDTVQSQLRLTHTEDAVFVDFTLDAGDDLTITPSSTGNIILQPSTDSTTFFQVLDADGGTPIINVDSTSEAVSLKTTTNGYTFQGSSVQSDLFIEGADTGSVRTVVFARSSDNAARAPTNSFIRSRAGAAALQSGDDVGIIIFSGHDGTDYNGSGSILVEVDGAVSANTVPMAMVFRTSATNFGGITDRLRIASNGKIGIGNVASPNAQVHIDQSSASLAEPVLLLDQADVDEPFTKYVGTAAAATLTNSIVAEADVTTATRQGFIKIEVEDIGNQVTDQDYFVPFYTLA